LVLLSILLCYLLLTKKKKVSFADWNRHTNCKKFFDDMMEKYKFKSLDDFYRVSPKYIIQNGGKSLLEKVFGGSLSKALQFVYPNHTWYPWLFKQQNLPNGYWDQKDNQKQFMNWLGKELGFQKMDDWYKLTRENIKFNGGTGLFERHGSSRLTLLQSTFSEHKWQRKFEMVQKTNAQFMNFRRSSQ
jgi:hypothetical protein